MCKRLLCRATQETSFAGKVDEVVRSGSDGWAGKRPKLGYLDTHVEEAVEWMKHEEAGKTMFSAAPSSTLQQVAIAACVH